MSWSITRVRVSNRRANGRPRPFAAALLPFAWHRPDGYRSSAFAGGPRNTNGRETRRIITCADCTTTRCISAGCSCRSWQKRRGPRCGKGSSLPSRRTNIAGSWNGSQCRTKALLRNALGNGRRADGHCQPALRSDRSRKRDDPISSPQAGRERIRRTKASCASGLRLRKLLLQLPQSGYLFPK